MNRVDGQPSTRFDWMVAASLSLDAVARELSMPSPFPPAPQQDPEVPFPELRARFRADPRALLGRCPGIQVIDKPGGTLTSHDLVAQARRAWRIRRIGHAGTLDPLASGVLLLLAGSATRLFDDCRAWNKAYRATFRLGTRTDSLDRSGVPLDPSAWTPRVPWAPGAFSMRTLEGALDAFRGDILQTPPMFSACKKNGHALHELARRGQTVERTPRPARVDRLVLDAFDPATGEGGLSMDVGSGFYVRALIDDWGVALGCGAVMTELRRTAVGPFTLADAVRPA